MPIGLINAKLLIQKFLENLVQFGLDTVSPLCTGSWKKSRKKQVNDEQFQVDQVENIKARKLKLIRQKIRISHTYFNFRINRKSSTT